MDEKKNEAQTPAAPRSAEYAPPHLVTVGRIVHFYEDAKRVRRGEPHAALVAAVVDDKGTATLAVFGDGEMFGGQLVVRRENVPHSDKPAAGRWSWQPRV